MCEALGECSLEVIEIGRNRLESKGAKALASLLNKRQTLIKLDVQQNGIKKEGAIELLRSIGNNKNITELHLNDNWIKGEEAINILGSVIQRCKGLRVLNLSDNNIGDILSIKLFEILAQEAIYLEELYYNYNELEQEAVIIKCLQCTLNLRSLKVLEMEGNGITEEIVEEYEGLLSKVQFKTNEEDN